MPAVAVVLCIWEAQSEAGWQQCRAGSSSSHGGVHGELEVLLHRPIVVGEPLEVSVAGSVPGRPGEPR